MTDIPIPDPPDDRPAGRGALYRLQPLLTLVIAVAAIGLAAWEGAENRRHNRLSVLPRLGAEIESGRNDAGTWARMAVESTGLGPAVITAFRIYLDGEVQDAETADGSRWDSVLALVGGDATEVNAHAFGAGYYFPPGRRYVLFEARRAPGAGESLPSLGDLTGRLALQVCYCSVYGSDCDEALLTASPVEAVPCPR